VGDDHGVVLIIEKVLIKRQRTGKSILQNLTYIVPTFLIVCFAWIFFRSNSISDALFIITHMFSDIHDYTDFLKLSLKFRGMGLKMSDLVILVFCLFILIGIELFIFNFK
jgi:alginate O-acetyltransferase complex protein AlgI